MARIRLYLDEAANDLPPVCMRCGEHADFYKKKNLSWHPPWAIVFLLLGLLPYVVAALIMTKRATLNGPFCQQHQGHWSKRTLATVLSLCVVLAAIVGALVLQNDPRFGQVSGAICFASAMLFLGWLVLIAVVQMTSIRPTEITERTVTITGVCHEFIDGLRDHRDGHMERKSREYRRYRDEEDDDDDDYERRRRE